MIKIIVIAVVLCFVAAQRGYYAVGDHHFHGHEDWHRPHHTHDQRGHNSRNNNGNNGGNGGQSGDDNNSKPVCIANKAINTTDLERNMPNSDPGKRIATTPFKNASLEIYKRMECECGPVREIVLNTTLDGDATCNGYHAWNSPWDYTATTSDGQQQTIHIGNFSQYYTYLNGNQYEVNFGRIDSGPCAGDMFFSTNSYVADDQLGCSGDGLKSTTIRYINATTSGSKCPNMKCHVVEGFFRYNPPLTNN